MEINKLVANDLQGDLKGFLSALQNMSPTGDIPLESAKEMLSEINKQNGNIYVMKTPEGEIVGTITLLVEKKFIHNGGYVGHIEDVAVRKGYEGKGIGGSLVKKALEEAKGFGCYKVILDCNDTLVPFYGRYGFSVQGKEMRVNLK